MSTTTQTSLDMRGKTITTFIAYEALRQLAGLADGETLELVTDASEEVDNDIRAWCRTRGQELAATGHTDGCQRYVITKRPLRPSGKRYAAVISDPGLEELLSPLAFALAAALEGSEVSLYFRGRRYGSWPKASPSTYAGRLVRSAGSPGPGLPGPVTCRRRKSSASSRRSAPACTRARGRCGISKWPGPTSPSAG